MKKQWHPTFARLLRPLVESHYDVKINVPVGDVPREADIVLLRRTAEGPLPFRGLWRYLTPWSVLEFKGRTVSPRRGDIDLLVEVGLGIHRRLNEERKREGVPPVGEAEVSFWYIVNHLGRRFLHEAEAHLGSLEEHAPGVWRCTVLGRLVFLVSGTDLPMEEDTLPLHLVGKGPPETEHELAEFLVRQPRLWQEYGSWLAILHRAAYRGVAAMAKTRRQKFDVDLEGLFEAVEPKRLLEELRRPEVIEAVGAKTLAKALLSRSLLDQLPPETCRELIEALRRQAEAATEGTAD